MNKDKQTLHELNKLPIELRDKVYYEYCNLLFEKKVAVRIEFSHLNKTGTVLIVSLIDNVLQNKNKALKEVVNFATLLEKLDIYISYR